jgi:hypothetical protein
MTGRANNRDFPTFASQAEPSVTVGDVSLKKISTACKLDKFTRYFGALAMILDDDVWLFINFTENNPGPVKEVNDNLSVILAGMLAE